jgi:hypothetical protein
MTLTWDTGGWGMKQALVRIYWFLVGQGQGHEKLQRCGVSRNIQQLNRWSEHPVARLLLSTATEFMVRSLCSEPILIIQLMFH